MVLAMRKEKDFLGELNLNDNEYYGIHTKRALDNFKISNYKIHAEFIKAMAETKMACALANAQTGYLDKDKAEYIAEACKKIIDKEYFEQFSLDVFQGGAGTSTNMNFNEVIANIALELSGNKKGDYDYIHPIHDVNKHQSTNDVYPTALKIAILRLLKKLENEISELQIAFQKKEEEFSDVVQIGRTQLQEAVPMTLGMKFGAFAEAIARDRWRIFKAKERIKVINLGGTAIGTGLGAPRKYIFKVSELIREITGLNIVRSENLLDTTQNNDQFVEVMGMIKAYATNLFKIASDIRLLNGAYSEITLPVVQTGSSIMPSKINPVIPESVSQVAIRVMANDMIISTVSSLGQLELNQFMPLLNHAILESLELLINATKMFYSKCIWGIGANAKKCGETVKKSYTLATVLVPYLGYKKVEEIIKNAKENNTSAYNQILTEKIISKEKLDYILSPNRMYKLGFTEKDKI